MDDEEIVRDVSGEMLDALGYEAESAADGKEAVDKYRAARDANAPFSAVILDLTVKGGGMGGEEALRQLLELDPKVLAVVSSGYAANPVVANYRSYGFTAALNKPYNFDSLQECLTALLPESALP